VEKFKIDKSSKKIKKD